MKKFKITTQCKMSEISQDPYWHPFQKGEEVHLVSKRSQDGTERYLLCSNGKQSSYLTDFDVTEII